MTPKDDPEMHEPAVAIRRTDTLTLVYLQLPATFVWAAAAGSDYEAQILEALKVLGLVPEIYD